MLRALPQRRKHDFYMRFSAMYFKYFNMNYSVYPSVPYFESILVENIHSRDSYLAFNTSPQFSYLSLLRRLA